MRQSNSFQRAILGVTAGAFCVALFSLPVSAQRPFGGARGGFPNMRALDLTEDQRDRIRDIRDQHRETDGSTHERLRAARRALNEAVMTDVVNEPVIRGLAADLAILESDAAVRRAHTYADVLQILTPEQRDQLEELRDEAGTRFRERRQQGRGERMRR